MSNNLKDSTLFLSQSNLDSQFDMIRRDVEFKTGTDLARYPNIRRQFQKMAQAVNQKCTNFNTENTTLTDFNQRLGKSAVDFFCNSIRQRSGSGSGSGSGFDSKSNNNTSPLYTSGLGFTTMDNPTSVRQGKEYQDMVSQRERRDRQAIPGVFDQGGRMGSTKIIGQPIDSSGNGVSSQHNQMYKQIVDNNGQLNLRTSGAGGSSHPGVNNSMVKDVGVNGVDSGNSDVKVLPFTVSDVYKSILSTTPGQDLPLYNNVLEIEKSVDETVEDRAARMALERQNLNTTNTRDPNMTAQSAMDQRTPNYSSIQQPSNFNMDLAPEATVGDKARIQQNTDALSFHQDQMQNHIGLQELRNAGEAKLLEQMTARGVGSNRMRPEDPLGDRVLLERLLEQQRTLQPQMMEVEHYIMINSIDRDWYNASAQQTRYNFRVKFRASSDEKGAHINELFRNVTRVELVQAILPQDNVLIPFDTRPYLDVLHFPHLILQIKELSEVVQGTNTEYDRTFSVLVFDKKQDSEVLSGDFISGSSDTMVNSAPKNQTNKQYHKGWYRFVPAYFEKKVFHNQPLAKLDAMTCRILTDKGKDINVQQDVMEIENIVYTSAISGLTESNFEYDLTHSYPNDDTASGRKYIRIQTTNCFSNKQYRLGDNIRIQGYDLLTSSANNGAFVSFINRDDGHYVLNTDVSNLAVGQNQGYTCNLYIAPPGNLNGTLNGLDVSTYLDGTDIDTGNYVDNSNVARLINTNLQTHYLFRVVTRQGDVQHYVEPMNIN